LSPGLHWYNKINGTTKRHFGKNILPGTKLRLYNITSKAALKCGSAVCVLHENECQQLERAQMKFLRSLLGLQSQTIKGTQQSEKN
jgi:hypothetical protein